MSDTLVIAEQSGVSRASALKILASIMGLTALVGSLLIGGSYYRARAGALRAQKDGAKFAQNAADWQFGDQMQRQADEMRPETDLKRIENDNLEIQIAEMQGRSAAHARQQLAIDEARLESAREVLDGDRMMDALGGDPHVAEAQERVQACEASFTTWSAVKQRDEHLSYALAALWVAFGFAWALSRPR